jgi:1-acyl-sn-glycerol-3-phosphate acyltransferase
MKLMNRHNIARAVLQPFVHAFCRIRYNARIFRFQSLARSKPPYFIISNHNSDQDPIFISLCFPFPVLHVASDHIFRWGLLSRIIEYFFAPIPKLKSSLDLKTITISTPR